MRIRMHLEVRLRAGPVVRLHGGDTDQGDPAGGAADGLQAGAVRLPVAHSTTCEAKHFSIQDPGSIKRPDLGAMAKDYPNLMQVQSVEKAKK
jgi:hypothetical protein